MNKFKVIHKLKKRTHRFSVTLSFAPKRSSGRTFFRKALSDERLGAKLRATENRCVCFFNLCILSSSTTALSTLCQGRLYPHLNKFKVNDFQEFQGVSRGKLCHFTLYIFTFSADSHHRQASTVSTPVLTCYGGCCRFR